MWKCKMMIWWKKCMMLLRLTPHGSHLVIIIAGSVDYRSHIMPCPQETVAFELYVSVEVIYLMSLSPSFFTSCPCPVSVTMILLSNFSLAVSNFKSLYLLYYHSYLIGLWMNTKQRHCMFFFVFCLLKHFWVWVYIIECGFMLLFTEFVSSFEKHTVFFFFL